MKQLVIIVFTLLLTNTVFSQSDCSKYYPFKAGVVSEITIYDKKDNTEAVVHYIVANSSATKATITSEVFDKKGDLIVSSNYDVLCNADGISIDFKSMMGNQMLEQYKDMEIEITGTNVDLPNNLTPGKNLADADMNMVINAGPIKMKMFVKMTNRQVVGHEKVSTPAGTFDCIVLTYDTEVKMGMKNISKHKQWLAEGVGMVKSEDYNKSGKLTNKSLLTKFEH